MNKIVFITTNIAPYRLMWFEELSKHFEVDVYYTKDREKDREESFLKHNSEKCKITKLNNPNDTGKLCFDVIDVVKNNKDNLIIFDGYGSTTNILGLVYCKLIHKKVFVNVDGFALGDNMPLWMRMMKKNIISHFCDYFFASSEVTKKHLIENGAKADNICVHNFSSIKESQILDKPLTKKEKNEIRKKLGLVEDKDIVLGVGQFIPRKRFEDLIQAIKKSDNKYELYILGGKPTKQYSELVGESKNIHFINFVKPEEVDEYYKASDVFALTSQTDVWGLVLNEAIAKGLPVVSSDNCIAGLSMINNNGEIHRTGDINQLKQAIDKCFDNYDEYSKNSLEIAKQYNIEGMVARQLPIINKYFKL